MLEKSILNFILHQEQAKLDKEKIFMRTVLNKILMSCWLVLLQTCAIGQHAVFCDEAKLIVSNFIHSKSTKDWGKVRSNVYRLQECKCEMGPVFYDIYRMNVLLPNSHSLQGISPNDFILSQKLKMRKQVKILNRCEKNLYSPLISAMITQNFDTEIAASATDLKYKLGANDYLK